MSRYLKIYGYLKTYKNSENVASTALLEKKLSDDKIQPTKRYIEFKKKKRNREAYKIQLPQHSLIYRNLN